MYLLSALLFALSANIDSFLIGLSCGIQKTRISIPQVFLISLITLCGTVAALLAGGELLSFLSFPYVKYAGNMILLIYGVYYVAKFLFMNLFHPVRQQTNSNRSVSFHSAPETDDSAPRLTLSLKTACIFGLSLSVNNLGIGLGASISGLPVIPSALISFMVSACFLLFGNHTGRCISFQKSGQYADLFCGILLVLLSLLC